MANTKIARTLQKALSDARNQQVATGGNLANRIGLCAEVWRFVMKSLRGRLMDVDISLGRLSQRHGSHRGTVRLPERSKKGRP
jgi:hypothetical protein